MTNSRAADASVKAQVGVLVMAHGTPADRDDVEPFATRVQRGRAPSVQQLADLRRRYDAIGGTSPLATRTQAQVEGLAGELEKTAPGRYLIRFGAKHADPFIEDAVASLLQTNLERVIGLVLTPHRSSLGSGEYHGRAAEALAARAGPRYVSIEQWYERPDFVGVLAERVRAARGALSVPSGRPVMVVFTAHSLPERIVTEGDPYPAQLADSARLVALKAGIAEWEVAWQSAPSTPERWLGPDVRDALRGLAARGYGGVVVCPIGFVADHLEVLYDLDIEARRVAEQAGLVYARTPSLNADPSFIEVLAQAIRLADVAHDAEDESVGSDHSAVGARADPRSSG